VTASAAYSICVGLEDEFLAFNRLVGVVRRRNLAIESLSIGAGPEAGVARVTIVVRADEGAVDRLVRQLRKVIGVRGAAAEPEASVASRELALIKVRTTGRYAEVLDAAGRFGATVLEEGRDEALLEVTGPGPMVLSLIRALEPFGVLDVARSGIVAVSRPGTAPAGVETHPMRHNDSERYQSVLTLRDDS
jgi:acetolactate synthase-1/3 small subunit